MTWNMQDCDFWSLKTAVENM